MPEGLFLDQADTEVLERLHGAGIGADFHPGHGHVVVTVIRFPVYTPHVPGQWIHLLPQGRGRG